MERVRLLILVSMMAGLLLTGEKAAEGQALHQHYGPAEAQDRPGPEGSLAPRLKNLGNHTFPVTTTSGHGQMFINQGMNLSYGFNHAEAGRAFREASRLDPNCKQVAFLNLPILKMIIFRTQIRIILIR